MSEASIHYWIASDGVSLAWREMGQGLPVILLHGLFSDGFVNWIKFGHADKLAQAGRRVIIPDLRAHGLSGKPHDATNYPPGILGRDLRELVEHLGLSSFDLGGFSLGARTVVQGVGCGLRPRRSVLAGMGLDGLVRWTNRRSFFLEAITAFETTNRGDPHWLAVQFMKTMKIDLKAAVPLLNSFEPAPAGWQEAFSMPTLVVCGHQDSDNGNGRDLAEALPDAMFFEVSGTHMSSVTEPALGDALVRFLT